MQSLHGWLCNSCGHTVDTPAFNLLAVWETGTCDVGSVESLVLTAHGLSIYIQHTQCRCKWAGHFREILNFCKRPRLLLWGMIEKQTFWEWNQPVANSLLLVKSLAVLSEAMSRFLMMFRKHKKPGCKTEEVPQAWMCGRTISTPWFTHCWHCWKCSYVLSALTVKTSSSLS